MQQDKNRPSSKTSDEEQDTHLFRQFLGTLKENKNYGIPLVLIPLMLGVWIVLDSMVAAPFISALS